MKQSLSDERRTNPSMKFTAVGDIIISRRIQENFAGYGELSDIIGRGDVRFFNLETTLNKEGECYAPSPIA